MNRSEKFDIWWEEYKAARQEIFFGLSKHDTEMRRQYALDGFLVGGIQLEEANDVITDLLLSKEHTDFCPAQSIASDEETARAICTCMNGHYYSEKEILRRAKVYTTKWSVE